MYFRKNFSTLNNIYLESYFLLFLLNFLNKRTTTKIHYTHAQITYTHYIYNLNRYKN